ncbi:hypothetical protein OKN36_19520 [Furfurilactobacillus sp. OKN36]
MNEDAVIKAAKKELNKCGRLMRQAGKRMSELKSPVFDSQPKSPSVTNHTEERMVRRIDAEEELRDILLAINLCDNLSKNILFSLYVDPSEPNDTDVMTELGLSERPYYRYKRRALYRFAEGFRYGEIFEAEKMVRI